MSANLTYDRDGVYPFLSEVAEMRRRARQHIQAASTSADQSIAHPTVLRLLNEALTTELACVSRYRSHSAMAGGAVADSVRNEFVEYAQEGGRDGPTRRRAAGPIWGGSLWCSHRTSVRRRPTERSSRSKPTDWPT